MLLSMSQYFDYLPRPKSRVYPISRTRYGLTCMTGRCVKVMRVTYNPANPYQDYISNTVDACNHFQLQSATSYDSYQHHLCILVTVLKSSSVNTSQTSDGTNTHFCMRVWFKRVSFCLCCALPKNATYTYQDLVETIGIKVFFLSGRHVMREEIGQITTFISHQLNDES